MKTMSSKYINIYSSEGVELAKVPITKECIHHSELMTANNIKLSWLDSVCNVLPLGASIFWEGVTWRLKDDYTPSQTDEMTWKYEPEFHHPAMLWEFYPFMFTDYNADGTIKQWETDWEITDRLENIIPLIAKSLWYNLYNEYKDDFKAKDISYENIDEFISIYIDEGNPKFSQIKSFTFSSKDIKSALNDIAQEYECEWWYEWDEEDECPTSISIYFGKCGQGDPITLKVGTNVSAPSTTKTDDNQAYTRFYVFGSNRNITQDSPIESSVVSYVVNKRLTLSQSVAPNGYIDKGELGKGNIHSKVLVFDEIYPRSSLVISSVASEEKNYYVDNQLVPLTDKDGNVIEGKYRTYTTFTITVGTLVGNSVFPFMFDDRTYSADNTPIEFAQPDGTSYSSKGMKIPGKNLTIHFNSGALNGFDFELSYKGDSVNGSLFEILFTENTSRILPDMIMCPYDGIVNNVHDYSKADKVTLYNIKMPDVYIYSAQQELYEKACEAIEEYGKDYNSYKLSCYPTYFKNNNIRLSVGQKVRFVNVQQRNGVTEEIYELETRVTSIDEHIDFVWDCEVTIGESQVKGNTATLKEEVLNINQNIDIMSALSDLSTLIQNQYGRAQQSISEGLAMWGNMWELVTDGTTGATYIKSKFDVAVQGDITAFHTENNAFRGSNIMDGVVVDNTTIEKNASGQLSIKRQGLPSAEVSAITKEDVNGVVLQVDKEYFEIDKA